MSDILEKWNREKKERIIKNGQSFDEQKPFCPYCGHRHDDDLWEKFDLTPNGEELESQCESCERHFAYSVDLSFSTRKLK